LTTTLENSFATTVDGAAQTVNLLAGTEPYKSGDHGFAHAHVKGGGPETRIGPKGNPYRTDPPLSAKQSKVVRDNRKQIRKAINKIGRWLKYKERK
jgi:hypothetical protein